MIGFNWIGPEVDTVGTKSITVNGAFLQEIKEDNQHLTELLAATADVLRQQPRGRIRATVLADLLRRTHDQLAMHFSLEEGLGYFEDAIDVPPRLSAQADILRSQHTSLFNELHDIVEDAERMLYHELSQSKETMIDRIALAYTSFYERFQTHEVGERELICQSLYEEIGGGD